jgi:hypothetical protein
MLSSGIVSKGASAYDRMRVCAIYFCSVLAKPKMWYAVKASALEKVVNTNTIRLKYKANLAVRCKRVMGYVPEHLLRQPVQSPAYMASQLRGIFTRRQLRKIAQIERMELSRQADRDKHKAAAEISNAYHEQGAVHADEIVSAWVLYFNKHKEQ